MADGDSGRTGLPLLPKKSPTRALQYTSTLSYSMQRFLSERDDECNAVASGIEDRRVGSDRLDDRSIDNRANWSIIDNLSEPTLEDRRRSGGYFGS